jgi:hypothetical protein
MWFQELAKWIFIGPLQSKSHIWNGDTMQAYLAFLTEELRARRREVGVGLESKALVICDSATQHSASKFAKMREIWSAQNNAVSCQKQLGAYIGREFFNVFCGFRCFT